MKSKTSRKTLKNTVASRIARAAGYFSKAKGPAPRTPVLRAFLDDDAIIVDNFAGGGGASSGVTRAMHSLGIAKSPDIAINHDAEAIAMHRANHPDTKHYIEDVWQVDPHEACDGRPVGLAWFSPTCTHFSKAKGTALDESSIKIRGLAWVAVRWAAAVRPRVICLENVEEFMKWGPLHRQHTDGCTGETRERRIDGRSRESEGCRKTCRLHKPIKEREGTLFRAFVSRLEKLGYVVEWRLLRACDYGAPTTRRRLFLVARCDGQAITWPEATHGPGREKPYRTAAECIDWSTECPSIFTRSKPLADKTLARIARGIDKFVLSTDKPYVAPKPCIVPVAYGGDARVNDIEEPLRTICGNRGGHAIAVPYLVHRSNGERREVVKSDGTVVLGQAPRIYDIQKPIGTIVAQGQKHAVTCAYLVKNNGGNNDAHGSSGQKLEEPLHTIATHNTKSLALAHLVKMRGTSEAHINASAHSLEDPVPTVSASGTHLAQVAAYLVRYNGTGDAESADRPMPTQTTKPRFGLVEVTLSTEVTERAMQVARFLGYDHPFVMELNGEQWVLVDIGMRMLAPRELYLAQGFDPDYVIECPGPNGKPLTKTSQIRMVGNSVPPVMAEVIARAQLAA